MLAEPAISVRIVEVARQVTHPVGEPLPSGLVEFVEMKPAIVRDESFHGLGEVRAPLRSSDGGEIDADETKLVGELMVVGEVIERWHNQTLGQVAGGAENDHRTGRRHRGVRGLPARFRSGAMIWPV